jgi:hypothetical protein
MSCCCIVLLLAQNPELFNRPMTIDIEAVYHSVGFGVSGFHFAETHARASDGSTMHRRRSTEWRGVFGRGKAQRDVTTLRSVPEHSYWTIDHEKRSAHLETGSIQHATGRSHETLQLHGSCIHEATRLISEPRYAGPGTVAGHTTERYRGKLPNERDRELEIEFALHLSCAQLAWTEWKVSFSAFRYESYSERITSIRFGEPDPALFQVPAGYVTRQD